MRHFSRLLALPALALGWALVVGPGPVLAQSDSDGATLKQAGGKAANQAKGKAAHQAQGREAHQAQGRDDNAGKGKKKAKGKLEDGRAKAEKKAKKK